MDPAMLPHSRIPQLCVLRQCALAEELANRDGRTKKIKTVVKNQPFQIVIGLNGNLVLNNRLIDFTHLTLDAVLLYDTDDDREVPFVKQKPIDFAGRVNDKGSQMTIDVRISVLSSHYENHCFRYNKRSFHCRGLSPFYLNAFSRYINRIKFQANETSSGAAVPCLVAFSEPIRVISKPDQLVKKQQGGGAAAASASKKRPRATANDSILEALARIEQEQKEHKELLQKIHQYEQEKEKQQQQPPQPQPQPMHHELLANVSLYSSIYPSSPQAPHLHPSSFSALQPRSHCPPQLPPGPPSLDMQQQQPPSREANLENAFNALVGAFKAFSDEERPEKIRKLHNNASVRTLEAFSEFVSLFSADASRELGLESALPQIFSACDCTHGMCLHQQKLEEIDRFYSDFLQLQ